MGRRWRGRYLEITYAIGAYRPYEALVADAAESVGLGRGCVGALAACYAGLSAHGPRGCYEPAASEAACLSMKQTKATTCRPAKVLAYRS